jgi:hypothetical protein
LPYAWWGLIAVYAWGAGGKLFWPERFRVILVQSGMVAPETVDVLVYAVPISELVLATAVALRRAWPLTLLLSTLLSLIFAAFHGYLLVSGDLVSCGCCGVAVDFSSRGWHVFLFLLSLGMLVASVTLLFSLPPGKTRRRLESSAQATGAAYGGAELVTDADAANESSAG